MKRSSHCAALDYFLSTWAGVPREIRSGSRSHLLIAGHCRFCGHISLQLKLLLAQRIPGSARTRHRFGDEVGAVVISSRHAETAASPRGGAQGWTAYLAPRPSARQGRTRAARRSPLSSHHAGNDGKIDA
jgi:hypothetical protein